jgi:hypothetical protein
MPGVEEHEQQWQHNRELTALIPRGYPDWIVTVVFYTALHAVDSLLRFDQVPGIVDHRARNDVLARTNRYSKVWRCYLPLYNLSRTVLYLARPIDWIPVDAVEREVLRRYLLPIEESVQKLTNRPREFKPLALMPTA